ncbi:flagellar hook-associated protein FlgL [Legionella fallonii]|uniref:Flagellar hook associated protein type 3 FlgL n=1 Tax=Legionella fallonii LLAP-10 TaxID=1212491 RepID=A0A098G545_9GAMM|nr:flagellar hook-associated protein FlgL [Legionella fallonii]CEG56615.1 Flagellar hook associated protein type 3 FlgL [Legionella fallonii LLAP-10]
MRISTNQIYERGLSSLLIQQERVSNLQERLASNLRVESPEDDPIATAQIELMNQRISTTEVLQKNRQNAVSALSLEDDVLSSTVSALQRLREIQVQAGDSSLSAEDRKSLAVEVSNLLNQIQDYANSKDISGGYMFSGGQAATQPFTLNSSGQYVYNGDSTQRYQAVSGNLQIAINDTGDNIFMRVASGNGTFAVSSPSTPNAGTASVSSGSIVNPSVYVPDNYTMSFALNSQGNLVVMVSGATSGNVIPASGLPDDAPVYQEGMAVTFNGMEMTVNGAPLAGDTFSITPSKNQSVFATIQNMITNLNQPFDTAVAKAATYTDNNQLLAELDSAITNILDYESDVGARLNQLTFADDLNSNLILLSKDTLKKLQEIDPVAVATEYNLQLVNLQAAQQSFVRIQGLSVFNYM